MKSRGDEQLERLSGAEASAAAALVSSISRHLSISKQRGIHILQLISDHTSTRAFWRFIFRALSGRVRELEPTRLWTPLSPASDQDGVCYCYYTTNEPPEGLA